MNWLRCVCLDLQPLFCIFRKKMKLFILMIYIPVVQWHCWHYCGTVVWHRCDTVMALLWHCCSTVGTAVWHRCGTVVALPVRALLRSFPGDEKRISGDLQQKESSSGNKNVNKQCLEKRMKRVKLQ